MQGIPLNLNIDHGPDPDVIAFLEANNLDPAEVLADQVAKSHGGKLTVKVFVRRGDSTRVLNLAGDGYVKEERTVSLLSAPENHNLRSL